MSRIENVIYRSWNEFKSSIVRELFDDDVFHQGAFVFRGQSSSEWTLTSSFDRWFTHINGRNRIETAQRLLQAFMKECESLDIAQGLQDDEVKCLALGQHYGLPTRLLDWSDSPYIAAFFAFNGTLLQHCVTDRVAVWALKVDSEVWTPEQGVEIVDVPSIGNVRLRNQAGKFTLSKTSFACLEDYVNQMGDGSTALWKFSIPAEEARRAMADLDAMGISHARMYPELVGYALAAKIRVILS